MSRPGLYLFFLLSLQAAIMQAQPKVSYAQDELIVKFKPGEAGRGLFEAVDFFKREDFDIDKIHPLTPDNQHGTLLIKFEGPLNIRQTKHALEQSGKFYYVEYNFIGYGSGMAMPVDLIPDDDHFDRQWGLLNDGSFSLADAVPDADIDMEEAWAIEQGDPSILIAILDSGLKIDHPDFERRIWENPLDGQDNMDNDLNGLTDDHQGWDFANADNNPADDVGHGTNIAGIFGANGNNGIGYAGMNWHSKIMPLKILNDENFGFYSWWIEAIYYAAGHGANVINMSVGGQSYSEAMEEAVNYAFEKGIPIVASMMNTNRGSRYYPAAYGNVIAVGSVDPDDARSVPFFWDPQSGSNFGDHIFVVAPGNYIFGPSHTSNTDYNGYWGGTSQAAGYVTGLVSLLLSHNPYLLPDEIKEILRFSSQDMVGDPEEDTEGWDQYYGHGRINAHTALTLTVTSTRELPMTKGITLMPNPVSGEDQLHVILDDQDLRVMGYRVIDYNGILHNYVSLEQHVSPLSIPTNALSPGNYLLLVETDSGNYISKFVKVF